MTNSAVAAPEGFQCRVLRNVFPVCAAQNSGLPVGLSASMSGSKLWGAFLKSARLFHRFTPTTSTSPTDPVTTLPNATDTFDYERSLQACAAGDRSAFQALYKQEARFLLGVALRIVRQRQLAEDILHDAFVNIWSKAATFDTALGSGRGWIYSVTRNLALNAVRSGAREVSVDEETAEALDAQISMDTYRHTSDAFELQANLGKLGQCLSSLEPARRDCILYAYVDGCSHGEIAERTQTPLGTVKAWIKRGMRSLRECMA